jgi:signal transduction histidine kinase
MTMSPITARRTATGLAVLALALPLADKLFVSSSFRGHDPGDSVYFAVTIAGSLVYLLIGRLIVSRQPGNTIGWLLLAIPVVGSLLLANADYATRALAEAPGSLPLGIWSGWLDRWLLVPSMFLFIPIFLLFPDGRVPSPRWRPVLALTIAAPVVTTISFALTPGRMTGAMAHLEHVHVQNPVGIGAPGGIVSTVTLVGGFAILASAILACVAIVARYRRAEPDVRQQIRWLAFVGVSFFVVFVVDLFLALVLHASDTVTNLMFMVMFITLVLGIPIACGIAILRYHLFDLDVVVKKAVVFGLLAGFIALVYTAIVTGIGALIGSGSSTLLSFLAAAALAIAFQPVRERARRFADRLVYGKRATPYEVLAEFSDRMAETYATDDVLPRMAQVLARGTGAADARVWLHVAGELRPEAASPQDAPSTASLRVVADELPAFPEGVHAVDVRHQGELLGALSVVMPVDDPMTPGRERLVRDLAAQAGLVLRNVRLIGELRASRQRLVAAQDDERRKLERNIHDGVQQQLVALAVQLRLLEQTVKRDPAAAATSASGLQDAATQALEDLRDLARGIYPPLLADKGLAAALEAQVRRSPIPVRVDADGVGRYPEEIEATVYFCSLEALNNVAKYAEASSARIELSVGNRVLTFRVVDDGAGFDPSATSYGTGLRGMDDRLDAIGGRLEVTSEPGRGTVVTGSVPLGPEGARGPEGAGTGEMHAGAPAAAAEPAV